MAINDLAQNIQNDFNKNNENVEVAGLLNLEKIDTPLGTGEVKDKDFSKVKILKPKEPYIPLEQTKGYTELKDKIKTDPRETYHFGSKKTMTTEEVVGAQKELDEEALKKLIDNFEEKPSSLAGLGKHAIQTSVQTFTDTSPAIAGYVTQAVITSGELMADLPYYGIRDLVVRPGTAIIDATGDYVFNKNWNLARAVDWFDKQPLEWSINAGRKLNKEVLDEVDNYLRPLNSWVIAEYTGYVQPSSRTFAHNLITRTAETTMPILPFLGGIKLIRNSPDIYNFFRSSIVAQLNPKEKIRLKETAENAKKGILEKGKAGLFHSLGYLNSGVGAGIAWSTTEEIAKNSKDPEEREFLKKMGPIMGLVGAFMGVKAPISLTSKTIYRGAKKIADIGTIGLSAAIATVAKIRGEGDTGFSRRAYLKAVGVPTASILKSFTKPLAGDKVGGDENFAELLKEATMGREVIEAFGAAFVKLEKTDPDVYRGLLSSFNAYKDIMNKYGEKGSENIKFYLGQVAGLSVLQSMQKLGLNQYRFNFFGSIKSRKMLSDLELNQRILEDQKKFIINNLVKNLPEQDYANLQNFLGAIDTTTKTLERSIDTNGLILKNAVQDTSVFLNRDRKLQISNFATAPINEGGLGAHVFEIPRNVEIEQFTKNITNQVDNLRTTNENILLRSIESNRSVASDKYDKFAETNKDVEDLGIITKELQEVKSNVISSHVKNKIQPSLRATAEIGEDLTALLRFTSLGDIKNIDGMRSIWNDVTQQLPSLQGKLTQGVAGAQKFNISSINKKVNDYINRGLDSEAYDFLRVELSKIKGIDKESEEILNDIIGTKVDVKTLLQIRSELSTKAFNQKNKNSKLSFDLGKIINSISNQLDILVTKGELPKNYVDAIDEAREFYATVFGEGIKGSLGKQVRSAGDLRQGGINDRSLEDFFMYFLDANSPSDAVKVFKNIFPKQEYGTNANLFNLAATQFQKSLGFNLMNQDNHNIINKLDIAKVSIFSNAGLITKEQTKNLLEIVRLKQDIFDSTTPDDLLKKVNYIQTTIVDNLRDLVKGEVSTDISDKIKNITSHDGLISAFVKEIAVRTGEKTRAEVRQDIVDSGDLGPAISTEEQVQRVIGVDRYREVALKDRQVSRRNTKNIINIEDATERLIQDVPETVGRDTLFNIVFSKLKQKQSKVEYFKSLSYVEELMCMHIYKQSISIAEKRLPPSIKNPSSTEKINEKLESVAKGDAVDWKTKAGITHDINIGEFAKTLTKIQPLMLRIAQEKDSLLGVTGKHVESFNKMKDMFVLSAMAAGKTLDITFKNIMTEIGTGAWLARGFGWIRGVVGGKWLATEAMVRIYHKNQIEFFIKMASDPVMIDTMHDIMVKKQRPTEKQVVYWKTVAANILGVTFNENVTNRNLADWLYYSYSTDQEDLIKRNFKSDVEVTKEYLEQKSPSLRMQQMKAKLPNPIVPKQPTKPRNIETYYGED